MVDKATAAGAGVHLAKTALRRWAEDGPDAALRVIDSAESALQLGYTSLYLLRILSHLANQLTESNPIMTGPALLRSWAEAMDDDVVLVQLEHIVSDIEQARDE